MVLMGSTERVSTKGRQAFVLWGCAVSEGSREQGWTGSLWLLEREQPSPAPAQLWGLIPPARCSLQLEELL